MKSQSIIGPSLYSKQHGFAIVSAIFLLVIIATLSVFVVRISTVVHKTSELDLRGDRAYQAARTGIEWGLYQTTLGSTYCLSPTNDTLSKLPGNLEEFQINVSCTSSAVSEGSSTQRIYSLVATATSGTVGTRSYVERQVSAAKSSQQ